MSEQLDKQTLTRLAWITELRRQGHRQCRHTGRDGFGGVCFMELLREITGVPETWNYARVGALAGLTMNQVLEGISRNDGRVGFRRHTFAELAGWLEGLR